jgi:hypothetical protein
LFPGRNKTSQFFTFSRSAPVRDLRPELRRGPADEAAQVDRLVRQLLGGDPDALEFIAFHLRADTVAGVFAINRGKEVRAAMKLIAAGVPVAAEELTDKSVDLRRLVRRVPTQLRPRIAYPSGA